MGLDQYRFGMIIQVMCCLALHLANAQGIYQNVNIKKFLKTFYQNDLEINVLKYNRSIIVKSILSRAIKMIKTVNANK